MARRLDIELTSDRGDGTWTWRAAGAKQPKGVLAGSLVPASISVGDIVSAEADADLEGLTITTVFAPKGPRKEAEVLQLLGSGRDEPLITQVLSPKRRRRGRDDDRGRSGQTGRAGRGRDDKRAENRRRPDKRRSGQAEGDRPPRRDRSKPLARPKAPRLRPARVHRQEALKALPALQHPLAEEVLRGGVPGVRQAVDRMNQKAAAEGIPRIKAQPLVALGEKLAPFLKAAEWRDRAEAAVVGINVVDLRDIRSVVVAADNAARDDESRALADQLRAGLAKRLEAEHRAWLDELAAHIGDQRTVRALRLSSRPPKAGAPLPVDMAKKLAAAAAAALTSEVTSDRYATVIDAVAFSPVRAQVTPEGVPASPSDELLKAVRKLASRVPQISTLFGIEAPAPRKRGGKGRLAPPPPPPPATPLSPAPADELNTDEPSADEEPTSAEEE